MEQQIRKYPVGIQTFSRLIQDGYVYVDKTDLVWEMVNFAKYIFLSRPRRFGKSLLSSTLESYFKGEKELFKGLKIMSLEKEWEHYPVLHFDLSTAKHLGPEGLKAELGLQLSEYEKLYGRNEAELSPGMRLGGVISRAYEQTGKLVAVIIDEYDAPLLDVLHDDGQLHEIREVLQEFYQRLKKSEPSIKFCFITGITKFSQLSIFSTLNNLTNITLLSKFSAICGITEEELCSTLWRDVELLADANKVSAVEMHQRLKLRYDGYHFSENSPEIYNPYSLLKAFLMQKIDNYWFESGTPTFLIRQLKHFNTDITSMDRLEVPAVAFDQPTENMRDALPLLYQCGYLTIKDYDADLESYTLAIPNLEVKIGYVSGLLPAYIGLNDTDVRMGFAAKFWKALRSRDIDLALRHMQAYLASIPYVDGFKKKLAEAASTEAFYEYTFYLIFSMLNVYVQTQVRVAKGRADMVVFMPDTIYIIELKAGGSAEEALKQIDDKGYAEPYQTDGRSIVKVGVNVNKETRTIEGWKIGS